MTHTDVASERRPLKAPVILLAEDDPELRALLGYGLGLDGYDVAATENGVGLAAWIAACADIAVVISDVRMPGPSGLEILARFRRTNTTIPFIVLTAFGSTELHEEALRLGASAVMDKPFEMDDLRALVRRLVSRRDPDSRFGSPEVTLH